VSLERSRDDMLALAARVLEEVPYGDGEVTVTETDAALTRFAHNAVHQNVAEHALSLRLRLQHEGRVGVATQRGGATDIDKAVQRLVTNAEEARRLAPPSEGLVDLMGANPRAEQEDGRAAWSESTASCEPERRADAVAVVAHAAAAHRFEAYGAMETSAEQRAIATTKGLRRCARTAHAELRATLRGGDGGGFAARCAIDVGDIDAAELAAEVVDTTRRNQDATPLDPGTYEVLFSPYAAADLLAWFALLVFNALAVQEHRSCYAKGDRLAGDAINLVDDPTDPAVRGFPFDGEGVTSRRVTLIDRGVAAGLVYDSPTARADGVKSSGHSLAQPNTFGAFAGHVVLVPGDAGLDELIGGMERGLVVTRLWYIRAVHELHTVVTGMTREGTFLVENGRVVGPVRDLRFTQSIAEALGTARRLGREPRLAVSEWGSSVLTPWLHVGAFTFTS
jgi:PmbA protein